MISVIVPVYKVERYLRQCIDSILNQTYRDVEILLIDDGSPDRCGEICEEYAKKDNRIRVFHTENKGLSAARNLGLREAKGEYIGFVDSDDWIEPDMYEILLNTFGENSDISACGVRREYSGSYYDYSIYNTVLKKQEAIQSLVCGLSNAVWNKLFKRSCWRGIEFPERQNTEDTAIIYKVFLNANSISCTSKVLYHYRMRNNSIVHTQTTKNLKDCWSAFYCRYLFLRSLPEFRSNQEFTNRMEEQIACTAVHIWLQTYNIPQKQRNYCFLRKVSFFVRRKYPLLGKAWWRMALRITIFFPRYANDVSIACLYALKKCYCLIHSSPKLYP